MASILFTSSTPVSAQTYTQEEYLDLITTYVNRIDNIYDGTWAYSYTNHDNMDGDSKTRRIDPSLPFQQSDRLIAENGGPPSADGLARHEQWMQKRQRQHKHEKDRSVVEEEVEREGNEKERFLDLLIPESVQLVNRDGHLHTLAFRGMEEDRRSIYEHIAGTLVLDTELGYIRELRIQTTEPFAPWLVMRINDGYFSLRFELINGRPVQSNATWKLDGHILYVKDLSRDQELEWFDIRKVVLDDAS